MLRYCAGVWATKFAASSVLPLPLYFATWGKGKRHWDCPRKMQMGSSGP